MFTRRLNGMEPLERKDLLAGPDCPLEFGSGAAATEAPEPVAADVDAPPCAEADADGDHAVVAAVPAAPRLPGPGGNLRPVQIEPGKIRYLWDVDGNGVFNQLDLVLVQIRASRGEFYWPGDANQDGRFNQADIVQLLQAGKYNTDQPATWGEGDFDGNGRFDSLDLVMALQTNVYEPTSHAGLSSNSGGF